VLKLLTRFAASRSTADAAKVVAYARKHPMALCLLSSDEQVLLIAAEAQAQA